MSDSTKLEFEVKDLNGEQFNLIKSSLTKLDGIKDIQLNDKTGSIYVESSLPSSVVHETIERNLKDKLAVLKGMGTEHTAVAEVRSREEHPPYKIQGVVRLVQLDNDKCVIDGTVDGLEAGEHALNVCEYGDLTNGCYSLGDHFNPFNRKHGLSTSQERHVGDLANIVANTNGRATFRFIDHQLKVWDVIGRSICVSQFGDNGSNNTGERLACGIIARSSKIFENVKRICACSGKTLWEERSEKKDEQATQSKI